MAAEMKSVGKDGELAQTTRRPPSDHVTSSAVHTHSPSATVLHLDLVCKQRQISS